MAELKTQKNSASILDFINSVADETRRSDALELLKVFEECTGDKSTMWGAGMIGYGTYHYKSERSTQEGDWPLTAFSPRKQNLTIYIMNGFDKYSADLKKLGKHKISSGSCLYIQKLSDVDVKILKKIIKDSFATMNQQHSA